MQENRKLTKPTFDNLSEEKRHLIIRTATSEFARNGFENTNINTIAEKAGISVGSLYKYFESKQDLFLFTIAHGTDVLKDVLSSIVPAALTLEEKLNALVEAIQTTSREQKELIRLYSELTSVGNSELVERLSYEIDYRQRFGIYLGATIEERDRFVREQVVAFIMNALRREEEP